MLNFIILQAEGGTSGDSFVVFLAILMLVFPVLFIRSLLKGWRPGTTGALFWKALLIFSSPFYMGVVMIRFFSITGLVSDDFGQLFPSLQQPSGNLPEVSGVNVNFWSELTVGLMAAALISGLSAILIYSIFKKRQASQKKLGSLVFWGALYASSIIIANGAFDLIQESALEGQAKKTQQQQQALKNKKTAKENNEEDLSRKIFTLGSSQEALEAKTPKSFDEIFRQNKIETEKQLGKLAEDAPDTVLEQFFRLANARAQSLATQDPLACNYFFQTGSYLRRFKNLFQNTNDSPEVTALLEALAREVSDPSSKTVTPGMGPGEFKSTTGVLYDRVRETVPRENQNFDVFDNPQKLVTSSEKANGCFTYEAYIGEISNLSSEDAIRYYRALLENRADALNAEAALAENASLLKLYQDMVPKGSPLDILFEDNPNLKKDFVLFLIENSGDPFDEARRKAGARKKELLDANVRYYFALATDSSIYGHISSHSTFLEQLGGDEPGLCGRMASALEEVDAGLLGTAAYKRHASSLAAVMKSSRTNENEFPDQMTSDLYEDTLDLVEVEMRRGLAGERPDLDILFYSSERITAVDLEKACRQAGAFYSALGRLGRERAATFYRAMLLKETS